MRILVYGAGVQGCQLAHSLAQNKKNVVTLLARGEWKEVIDQKGLTIRHMLQRKTTVDRMQTTDVLAPGDVLLHGHTHVPAWTEFGQGNLYLNPGSVSIPKENSPHSYMTLEENTMQWKELESSAVFHELTL